MSCYQNRIVGNKTGNKNKAELDFTSYATKKELEHVTCVDTSDLAVKKILLL